MRPLLLTLLALSLPLPAVATSMRSPSEPDPIQTGYTLYYRGDMMVAYRHFVKLLRDDPDNLAAAYGALSSVYARNRVEETLDKEFHRRAAALIKNAEALYDADADNLEALFFLAQTYGLRAGYSFERRESLYRAARDAANSKHYSEKYVRLNPSNADALIALGLYNYYSDLAPALLKVVRYILFIPGGNRKLGLAQIERAAKHAPTWSPQARMELVRIYTWTEGRIDEGLRLAAGLRRDYPHNAELAFRLARMAAGPVLEDPGQAAEIYSGEMRHWKPESSAYASAVHAQAVLGLIEAKAQMWQLGEADAIATEALAGNVSRPRWAKPKLLLARAKVRAMLNDQRAELDLRQIINSPGKERWKDAARARLRWAKSRRASGEAILFALLLPGNRLVADKKYAEARSFYLRVQQQYPAAVQIRYRLARLAFLEGRTSEARRLFGELKQRAGRRTPRWLTAGTLLHLARLHDVAGERKRAVKLYEEVVDDFEEEPEALAARIGMLNPYQPAQLARR